MLKKPACVYINGAAYDELSDTVELTEALALEQFEHLLRLRGLGVQIDYYLMDAFWYARNGGYRTWRKPHGLPARSKGGAPPQGKALDTIIGIRAAHGGRAVPVHVNYDKAIWSGLSWGVGEVRCARQRGRTPLSICCTSSDPRVARLLVEVYRVRQNGGGTQ
jgi:hypothetical protein